MPSKGPVLIRGYQAWAGAEVFRRRPRVPLLMTGYPDWSTTKELMGILMRSYRPTLRVIREDLAAFGGVLKHGGNRYLISSLTIERYLRSRQVMPIPKTARTDSIWMQRAKGQNGGRTGTE